MDKPNLKILLVEDNPADIIFLREALDQDTLTSFDLTTVEYLSAALELLKNRPFDIILLDLGLPDSQGLETFTRLHKTAPELPHIILSGLTDEVFALQAMHAGAQDYLVKGPTGFASAARAIRYAIERQQAQKALRESEARFKGVLNSAPDGIVVINQAGQIILVNHQVEKLFGYAQTELLGNTLDMLLPERLRLNHTEHSSNFFTNPHDQDMHADSGLDLYARRQDGSEFPVEINLSYYNIGDEVIVISSIRDITRRRKTEAALQAEQLRFARIAATAPGAIYTFRLRPDGSLCIPYASQAFESLFGLTLAEVAENVNTIVARIPPAAATRMVETVHESARTLQPWYNEYPYRHPVKGDIWLEGHSMPVREADSGTVWHGFVTDITQRKRLEKEHVRQERLAAVGQLAAGIAHDFNNLLMTITGNADLLQHRFDVSQNVKSRLAVIVQQSERAAQLTRQILDFSRQTVNEPQPLDLKVYLNETLRFIERTIPETIEIRFDFDQIDYAINADPTQLQQVITNLAINARDAMPNGGTLSFELAHINVAPRQTPLCPGMAAGEWVKLTVTDTGAGIAQDVLPHIFEPFFTTKQVGQGTGLGLAQIYGIVLQHHGCITVNSQVGQGATFTLYFPAITAAAVGKSEGVEEISAGQGETILLVEDEPNVLNVTRAMLEMLNYRVLTAGNGAEALNVYRAQADQIALVLTDAVMPVMDGFALAAALQAESPGLPILLISGYAGGAESTPETMQNITTHLQKPLGVHQLGQALKEVLEVLPREKR